MYSQMNEDTLSTVLLVYGMLTDKFVANLALTTPFDP